MPGLGGPRIGQRSWSSNDIRTSEVGQGTTGQAGCFRTVLVPWSSNMPYLVHVLFKQYYLSNVDAQNQSLFKQCNLSNVKNSKSGNISKSGN